MTRGRTRAGPRRADRERPALPRRWLASVLVAGAVLLFSAAGAISLRAPVLPPTPAPPAPTLVDVEVLSSLTGDSVVDANFTVTVGVAVHLTVINRDLVAAGAPEPYASSWGAFAGPVQTHWAGPAGGPASLVAAQVSHTFTMNSPLPLSVPIPAASAQFGPSWVSFTVYFNATGTYHWFCASFCDDVPGESLPPMGGTITVTD